MFCMVYGGFCMGRNLILVIEDDPHLGSLIEDLLQTDGYATCRTMTALGAMALAREIHPHAIVLDLGLPFRSGASLLRDIRHDTTTAEIPTVVVSGMPEVLNPEDRALASAVLGKPFDMFGLLDLLRILTVPQTAAPRA